jgi:chromosome segregation ATPase
VALCKEQERHKTDMQSLGELETTQAKLKDTKAQLDDALAQLQDARSQQRSEDDCGNLEAKETELNLTRAALEEKEAQLKSVREELESEKARSAELGSIHTDFEAARAKLKALHKELESEKAMSKALEGLREELADEEERSAKLEADLQAKQAKLTTELNNVKTKLDAELARSSQLGIEPSTVRRELEKTQLKLRRSQRQWKSVSDKLKITRKDLETERDVTAPLESQLWTREAAWGLGFTQGFDTLRDLVEGGPPKMDISKLDAEDFVPGSETLEALASLEDHIAGDGPSVPEGVLHEEDPAAPGTDEAQSSSSSA